MRSFVVLYWFRNDLGSDLAELLLPVADRCYFHDHRVYAVLL